MMGWIELGLFSSTRISVMTPVMPFEIPLEIRELSRNITRPLMQMLTSSGKLVYCLKDFALSDKVNTQSPSQSMAGEMIGVRDRLCAMKLLILRAVSHRATMKVDSQTVFAIVNCSWRSCKRVQDSSEIFPTLTSSNNFTNALSSRWRRETVRNNGRKRLQKLEP